MRTASYSAQFERDVKRLRKRGKDLEKLKSFVKLLLAETLLPPQYKDHPLRRNWSGYRDAHLEPDWVVIYSTTSKKCPL